MSIKRIQVGERMSQAVIHGSTVTTAGVVAQTAPGGTIAEQTRDILDRIDGLLAEAGTDKSKLLTGMIWITDMAGFDEMNSVWDTWVTPGATPVRACVESKLASPKFNVEIQVSAALD
jgi:enamine deaminase RidA (YjgF/YER057c/UK114 family)